MIGTFKSLDGISYSVQIGGTTGTMKMADDPVRLHWETADHLYVPFRSLSATIKILTQDDLSGLYTADPLGVHVLVKKANDIIFDGFLTPQEWKSDADNGWKEVELEAVDAITALKSVAYERKSTMAALYSPSDYIEYMLQVLDEKGADITFVDTLPWDRAGINEAAFLPEDWDASVHSSSRKSWCKVIEALGTFLGGTFMMEGDKLRFFAVDDVAAETCVDVSSVRKGARTSIEPAKSSVTVSYDDTAEMRLVPEMDQERFGEEVIKKITIDADYTYDDVDQTTLLYFDAKDWEPTDNRAVCGALVYDRDSYFSHEKGNEQFCVVGPCQLKTLSRRLITANCMCGDESQEGEYRKIRIKISGWSGSNVAKEDGYAKMGVYSKPSVNTFNSYIKFYIGQLLICEIQCPISHTGFTETEWVYAHVEFINLKHGELLNVVVPDCVAIGSISIEMSPQYAFDSSRSQALLLNTERDYITSICDDYNDGLSVDATLRPMPSEWSVCDVASKAGAKATSSVAEWDKYPYVNVNQYKKPRRRVSLETTTISRLNMRCGYSIGDGRTYVADGAEYDLRNGTATLNLLESCVGDEDDEE